MKSTEPIIATEAEPLPPPASLAVWVAESGPAAPRLPLAFESFLYLTPEHQRLQADAGPVLSFYLEDAAAGRTVAQLHFGRCNHIMEIL